MEVLSTKGLCKTFGGVHAINNVSFAVETGERVAIIGSNGAGKTTLFNLINGQEKATSGQVYLFGQDVTMLPTYSRAHTGLSRSSQVLMLFPNLTVLNSTLLAVQGTKSCRFQLFRPITAYKYLYTRAEKVLEGMSLKGQEVVRTLSYGEQRELEIALSLASEPKILLLDEPNCGLTTAESADIVTKISNLGTNVTVVLIAHDMDLVFGLATRIIALHYGQIIADGTNDEIQANARVREIYLGLEEET